MLLIRKVWLLPTIGLLLILYYRFYHLSGPPVQIIHSDAKLQIRPERHPVQTYFQLPTGPAKSLPRIQHIFTTETELQKSIRLERQAVIKEAFAHSWDGYRRHAWRYDEVGPLSGRPRNTFGGWGATLVDTMDTLWIMGLKKEFEECVEAIKLIDFTTNSDDMINVFETTIRYLGGFLSAHDLSNHKYPAILSKAVELAEMLYITFDTPNRYPATRWYWKNSVAGSPLQAAKNTLLAEIGSMSLEFTRLAQLTGDAKWFDAIERITTFLYEAQSKTKIPGLWPTIVDAETGTMSYNHFTLGGMADSTSEYLPKQYMILGGLDERYRTMYEGLIAAAKKHLFYSPITPSRDPILFSGNAALDQNGKPSTEPQGQHLACFVGGMVGIASRIFERPEELQIAKRLVEGCIWAYNSTPSGLMPETFHLAPCHFGVDKDVACEWSEDKWLEAVARQQVTGAQSSLQSLTELGRTLVDQQKLSPGFTRWGDNRYILRPEAIESVFIMYRLTGERSYMDTAWTMWTSISKACKTPLAYAGVADVRTIPPSQSDRMESFWLAETLKYFYLIFSDPNEWSLDDWVLNTEAHFLQRPKPGESLTTKSG